MDRKVLAEKETDLREAAAAIRAILWSGPTVTADLASIRLEFDNTAEFAKAGRGTYSKD